MTGSDIPTASPDPTLAVDIDACCRLTGEFVVRSVLTKAELDAAHS